MPNPYPATFEVAENLHVRLDGDVTFTDPANQPGGGGGGQVNSVTAGDASITIAGTVTDPTVAVAALGVTSGKIASNAVTQAKLAANAVGAAQMDSGAASANWVPVADGTGGVVYAASPGVNSLTAADTSIVVGGTSASPTVRTGTLDTIATQHPPTAAVALNSQKITGLANGTVATDAAAFGQIPTALPPNGSAGGDLSGTYPNPTVAAVQGVAVSSTAPTANQVLTASDATHAAWATPSGGIPSGTSFPGSPSNADLFYRTDLARIYEYNSSASLWLEVAPSRVSNFTSNASGGASQYWPVIGTSYLVTCYVRTFVATTNNASNYWTLTFYKTTSANVTTSLGSSNTSADSVAHWGSHDISLATSVDTATYPIVQIAYTQNGTPGNLYLATELQFRVAG